MTIKFEQHSTKIGLFGLVIILGIIITKLFGKDDIDELLALYIGVSSLYRTLVDTSNGK